MLICLPMMDCSLVYTEAECQIFLKSGSFDDFLGASPEFSPVREMIAQGSDSPKYFLTEQNSSDQYPV